jgi:hypothetical protein
LRLDDVLESSTVENEWARLCDGPDVGVSEGVLRTPRGMGFDVISDHCEFDTTLCLTPSPDPFLDSSSSACAVLGGVIGGKTNCGGFCRLSDGLTTGLESTVVQQMFTDKAVLGSIVANNM